MITRGASSRYVSLTLLAATAIFTPSCGGESPEEMILGIQLQACDYSFSSRDLLDEGSDQILELGSNAVGIYIGPEYAEYYPRTECGARSLAELAASPAYKRLFEKPLSTYLLTSYSFANGLDGRWQQGIESYNLQAAYDEIRELCEHLLRTYSDSGKTFVIKNWEGDWHLLGSYQSDAAPTDSAIHAMTGWLHARVKAVEDARKSVGAEGISLLSAVEFNLVLKAQGGRRTVLTEVVPNLKADLYSYSCWDGIRQPRKLTERLNFIKQFAPDSEAFGNRNVFLGELGIPEKVEHKRVIIRWNLKLAREWGVPYAFYWQLYDNECDGKAYYPAGVEEREALNCRGFWLIDKFGELSEMGRYVKRYLAGDRRE